MKSDQQIDYRVDDNGAGDPRPALGEISLKRYDMKKLVIFSASLAMALAPAFAFDDGNNGNTGNNKFQVNPWTYDPAHTNLVFSGWLDGTGCPTNASIAAYPATRPTGTFTDPACATGDTSDRANQGLLLVKTGPTVNNASAGADIKGLKTGTVTELGYDIRKPGSPLGIADPRGSHCGAGAPRFNLTTTTGTTYFIGCSSPPPTTVVTGAGWLRLRWGGSTPLMAYGPTFTLTNISGFQFKSISIVFDEGQDTGPDNFGAAFLDNIDVNGVLVGHGPSTGSNNGSDNNQGDKGDN